MSKESNLINHVPCGIGIYEIKNGKAFLTYINDAYYKMLGYTREERAIYMGEKHVEAVYPEDMEPVWESIQDIIDGSDDIDVMYRIWNKAGELIWIRMVGLVVERKEDNIVLYCSYSDCNAIKKAQEELESNRILLNVAMESAQIVAWKYDILNHCIIFSDAKETKDHQPVIIKNAPDSLPTFFRLSKESIEVSRLLHEKIQQGERVEADMRFSAVQKEGCIWRHIIYTPVFDREGKLTEAIGIALDVTKQREREQKYKNQLRIKKMLAKDSRAFVIYNLTKNEVTEIESDEPELIKMMQAGTADDVLAMIREGTKNETEKKAFAPVRNHQVMLKAFARGETHFTVRHHLKDSLGWVESNFDIIMNPYTCDIEAIATLRDINEKVRNEMIVNTLVTANYESIMTIDVNTGEPKPYIYSKIGNVTKEQKRVGDNVLGVAQYIRKHCTDSDVERVVRETSMPYVKEQLEKMPVHTTSYTLRENHRIVHKQMLYTYLDDEKQVLLCASQDLSETYALEEKQKKELKNALQAAEQANKAKTEFFSHISHDMRTPMNGILGMVELSEKEEDIKTLRHNIDKIKESGQYLLSLINDTLDFQRIESDRMELDSVIVKGKQIAESIIDMVRISAEEKNIDFKVINHNVDFNWYVKLDPVRIKQIFINLLSNAIKFTPEGGTVYMEFRCLERKGNKAHCQIKIKDTGIGMSREFIQHGIFNPFSQEYNQYSSEYAGSGLGLSIVHKLVELMGGRIAVESQLGVGTTFIVEMEFEHVAETDRKEEERLKKEQYNLKNLENLDGKRILLIEDHPLNAEIIQKLLEKTGCRIIWRKDGAEGVECYERSMLQYFDAVLMDIRMPVMNGIDATKAIRALNRVDAKQVPIIALTANAYEEDIKNTIQAGANAHLSKPIDPQLLYQTLVEYIKES